MKPTPFEPLDAGMYRELVRRALAEDFGWGDVTTEAIIDREQKARGVILAKSACVMAGVNIAAETFRQMDPAGRGYFGSPALARADTGRRAMTLRARLIADGLLRALDAWPRGAARGRR